MRTLLRATTSTGAVVNSLFSEVVDGDFSLESPQRSTNEQRLVEGAWTWIRQVHGLEVLRVEFPGHREGERADALVTSVAGAILSVRTADCAPVVFVAENGAVGIAHAGWKGLEAGVLEATVAELRVSGPGEIWAVLGPCIHACCYEFGDDDLSRLCGRFGPSVAATTRAGQQAFDLAAGVRAVLEAEGVELRSMQDSCTEDDSLYSYRLRQQSERFVTCVWIEA